MFDGRANVVVQNIFDKSTYNHRFTSASVQCAGMLSTDLLRPSMFFWKIYCGRAGILPRGFASRGAGALKILSLLTRSTILPRLITKVREVLLINSKGTSVCPQSLSLDTPSWTSFQM